MRRMTKINNGHLKYKINPITQKQSKNLKERFKCWNILMLNIRLKGNIFLGLLFQESDF